MSEVSTQSIDPIECESPGVQPDGFPAKVAHPEAGEDAPALSHRPAKGLLGALGRLGPQRPHGGTPDGIRTRAGLPTPPHEGPTAD